MSQPADVLTGAYAALIARKLGTLGDPIHLYSTTTLTVPTGVVRAYVRLKGPGGSGAVIKNDTQGSASGGGGGGYSEGWLVVVPGESMVCTVPAGAAGVTSEGAGTGGSTASIAVASKTISCTGGCAGSISTTNAVATANGTAGVGSNGDINTSGGLPGQCTCVTSRWQTSGGASAGNPYGNGAQSGTCATSFAASGGASMYAASGASTSSVPSGGAGWRGASGSASTIPTAGGGPFEASTADSTQNVNGVTTSMLGSHPVFALSTPFGSSGSGVAAATVASAATANGNGGGGGGVAASATGVSAGDGGFGAGGGACVANVASLAIRGGHGGPYGGGGSCNQLNSATPGAAQGGTGGIGAGGGAVAGITTGAGTFTSGRGGPAEAVIQWVWP